ncbi:MAG: threonine synthase [Caulobacteraceae bacterium]
MRFISTRGRSPEAGFLDVLLAGLAPDGGLYIPQSWPRLSRDEIAAFAGRPYAEVAAAILGRFAGAEIEAEALERICAKAYAAFSNTAVTPLRQLTPTRFLLELFHGPTLAFKDIAMQAMAGLFEHALAARGRTMTIVAATSGDTGGAAAAAFANLAGVRLVVLLPEGRVTEVQRRFMTTTGADNVRCVAVDGDFDACQAILKALFADEAFAREAELAAVNSINLARVAAQSVYYFAAASALGAPHRSVAFAVPTGNFGDAYAGWAARRMGLPIERLIVATNANDIVTRALAGGVYRRGGVIPTQSPAMDIQVASNFERIHFEYAGRGNLETAAAYAKFERTGELRLAPATRAAMSEVFEAHAISETATGEAMRKAWDETGQLVDPHTAVALAGADAATPLPARTPLVVLATADPAKFPEAMAAAGLTPDAARVEALGMLVERFDRLPADASAVKAYVRDWP